MAKIYRNLIMKTKETGKTIDDVPVELKEKVLELLALEGLNGYGEPLVV